MKSVVFKEISQPLVIEERPQPSPGPHQLLLKVKAVGICGSDLHASEEEWMPKDVVMGHEFAGEVVAVGDAVTDWHVGDRALPMVNVVCGKCENCRRKHWSDFANLQEIGFNAGHDGAYAEYVIVSAPNCLRMPDNLSYDDAAVIEPLAVGYDTVRRCELKMDDAVLVIGAGPVGLAITQWCKHFGVTDVVVSELNTARLALAEKMGATHTIDGNQHADPVEEFERLTGRQPTVIVEAVGIPGMIQRCIAMAPKESRIVVVGLCMKPDQFEPMQCILKSLKLIFAFGYSVEDYAEIVKLLGQGRITAKPLISHRIGLEELPAMFESMRRPTDQIKVIVKP